MRKPAKTVVFGMTSLGRVQQISPVFEKMSFDDMGMYVHFDEFNRVLELVAAIKKHCYEIQGMSYGERTGEILKEIIQYEKEVEL